MPGKAAYLALDEDDELEYSIYLARKLNRTVAELRDTMSHSEFLLQSRFDAREAQRREVGL